jgi:hypothetical protein
MIGYFLWWSILTFQENLQSHFQLQKK